MSHYFEIDELKALIPSQWLVGALDDDANATAEMFEQCRQAAEEEIDGYISLRYAVPIRPVPLFIKQAAMKFAAELCYARRGAADQFPWKEAVTVLRGNGMVTGTMTKIATGEIPLFPKSGGDAAGKGRSKAYVEPSKIHSTRSNA